MKKLLIASAICCIPVVLLGIVNPLISFWTPGQNVSNVFFVYIIILAVSISVIITAVLSMTRYTSVISDLEKEKARVEEKCVQLDKLIRQYNSMILKNTNP